MKCLVLGGLGFIGKHLSVKLSSLGHDVTILDFLSVDRTDHPPDVTVVSSDLLNVDKLREAMAGTDVVVHLAASTLPDSSNTNMIYDVESNIVGTLRMLDLAVACEVKKVLFASSGGTVYGRNCALPINESQPLQPVCSYGVTKVAIEKYLYLYHDLYGLSYGVLRLSNPFGPGRRLNSQQGVVSVFITKMLEGEPLQVLGDGSVVRDYIYIDDAIDAFLRVLQYEGTERIFNIGSGVGRSLNDLIRALQKLTSGKLTVENLPERGCDVPVNVLDCRRAREVLGWEPKQDFEQGLCLTRDYIAAKLGRAFGR